MISKVLTTWADIKYSSLDTPHGIVTDNTFKVIKTLAIGKRLLTRKTK